MPQYTLREVDPHIWSLFIERAGREGWPTKALLVKLMDAYGRGDVSIGTPPPKQLPQWAWLRAYYREVARADSFRDLDVDARWRALVMHVAGSPAGTSWRELDALPLVDRSQILRWLEETSALTRREGLTLRAQLHFHHTFLVGSRVETERTVWQYEVLGLPPNQQAQITDFDGGWRILLAVNGKTSGTWSGPHKTPEDALDTLARMFEEEAGRRTGLVVENRPMESFSDEVKTLYGDRDEPAKIEEALARLDALKVASSDGIALSPVSTLPSKLFDLVQFGVRRGIELGEAAVREINRLNVSSSCTLVRGVLETACLLYDTIRKVEAAVEKRDADAVDDLDKWLTNALLGHGPKAQTFMVAEEFVVQNILTIIQRLDKQLEGPFGGFYEGLSEHAHPNYHGMMALYFDGRDEAISKFTDHREGGTRASLVLAICALATSFDVLALVAQKRAELSDELATLSERRIYERGSWPADVAYPIQRAHRDDAEEHHEDQPV